MSGISESEATQASILRDQIADAMWTDYLAELATSSVHWGVEEKYKKNAGGNVHLSLHWIRGDHLKQNGVVSASHDSDVLSLETAQACPATPLAASIQSLAPALAQMSAGLASVEMALLGPHPAAPAGDNANLNEPVRPEDGANRKRFENAMDDVYSLCQKQNSGCVYHMIMGFPSYQVFKLPSRICFQCSAPTSISHIGHNMGNCTNRVWEQNFFHGLPYIVFRVKPLSTLIFEHLDIAEYVDSFKTTMDYVRWLSLSVTKECPPFLRLHTVVWVYTNLIETKKLSEGGIVWDFDDYEQDPPTFGAQQ
ncbi:hypothetical protein K435DRAFT_809941 [Dendrothele bispora CBS 962.96]|uniref:Uncharacterized protein n=1 Tax=Dendrothele bispora (strain CBS 962.96) TaxID=1314807 RepID=A0A4S8KWL6_DENBC|nr:hypothetical protein K435DRAFT_809941 [Dendrothele bispora CBS 962.96]